MKNFKFDISDIRTQKGASKKVDEKLDIGRAELRGQTIDIGTISLQGEAENVEEGIMLKATAEGMLILTCSRCLDKFKHPLKIKVQEFFDFEDVEAEHIVEDDSINLTAVIVEALALNLNIKTLCKEDCSGICPSCGINLNKEQCECKEQGIDIRWHKLQDLKRKMEGS